MEGFADEGEGFGVGYVIEDCENDFIVEEIEGVGRLGFLVHDLKLG